MSNNDGLLRILDFSGGLNSYDPEFAVAENQAVDLDNINLFDQGFEKRRGDTAFNSSAMVSASSDVTGLHYMKFNSGTEFLNAVCGGKFFTSSSLSGTMADKTGGLTISADQDDYWNAVSFNDLQIWFGGAPNAPFKHDGTGGNAAALGGSPPSAKFVFQAANRLFACSTTANPSRIQWSVLSDPEDWTGTGSGNSDVSENDGEELLVGIPVGSNQALLFKNSSTHKMILDQAPFPIFPIQQQVGLAGRRAWVVVNGEIFFITPSRRMKSTLDGATFQDYPSSIDDKWDDINTARISNIVGVYYDNLKQIHWYVSTGTNTTNDQVYIWDLRRRVWLRHSTGYKVNTAHIVQNRRLFCGHYDGIIYEKDVASTYNDASESSGAIDAYWKTKWYFNDSFSGIIHPRWVDVAVLSQTTGTFTISWGFDFTSTSVSRDTSMQSTGGIWGVALWGQGKWGIQTSLIKRIFLSDRGNNMQLQFKNDNVDQNFVLQGATLAIRAVRDRKQSTSN